MKFTILLTFFTLSITSSSILDAFGTGNVDEISKKFAPEVLISINDNLDFYVPDKAKLVLQSFFEENKPSKVKQIFSDNEKMLTGNLTCSTGVFRLSVVLENNKIVEVQLTKN